MIASPDPGGRPLLRAAGLVLGVGWLCLTSGVALCQEGRPAPKERQNRPGSGLEEVLRVLDEKQENLKDLEASFVQTQVIALLREPDVSEGRLYWREGLLRMDWSKPQKTVLLLDEEGLLMYMPDEGRAERFRSRDDENFGALFPGFGQTSEEMKKTYEIRLITEGESPTTWRLDLRPRREKLKRWVGGITLWIDREKGVPVKIRLDDPNGKDHTVTVLSETKVNGGIPKGRFEIALPEGTRVTTPAGGLPF